MTKPRPTNLAKPPDYVERFSARHEPFQMPVNAEVEHGCVPAGVRKLTRDTSQNPAMYSRVKQQDDTQYASTRKQDRGSEFSDSPGPWTQVRGVDTQMGRSRMKFRNMKISNYPY